MAPMESITKRRESMASPTRDEIKPLVVAKLKATTDEDVLVDDETSELKRDLGMTSLLVQAMSVPYTKISLRYPAGIAVTVKAAGKCETVKDSIDLVYKCANGGA